jgi:hypothetical protein
MGPATERRFGRCRKIGGRDRRNKSNHDSILPEGRAHESAMVFFVIVKVSVEGEPSKKD